MKLSSPTLVALAVALAAAAALDAVAQGRGGGGGRGADKSAPKDRGGSAPKEGTAPKDVDSSDRRPGAKPGRGPDAPPLPPRDKRDINIEPGGVTSEILCDANPEWSYRLYAPRAYTPARRWPTLFVIAAGGGTSQTARRFADAAEFNGFLVAVSTQAGKSGKNDLQAFEAMVRDVRDRIPTDPRRFFFSGFAEGARLVMAAAAAPRDFTVAGLLAIGDGDPAALRGRSVPLYALCGTNSPRRQNVARLFEPPAPDNGRLEWFAGGHEWGDAEDLSIALTWLNATALRAAPAGAADLQEARAALEKSLAMLVRQRRATSPERAADWAECLTALTTPPDQEGGVRVPHPLALELRSDPRVRLYREARAELFAFAMRFFEPGGAGAAPDPQAALKARELAFRYRETRLRPAFERLAQPVAGER